jgi:hypothetical protein
MGIQSGWKKARIVEVTGSAGGAPSLVSLLPSTGDVVKMRSNRGGAMMWIAGMNGSRKVVAECIRKAR